MLQKFCIYIKIWQFSWAWRNTSKSTLSFIKIRKLGGKIQKHHSVDLNCWATTLVVYWNQSVSHITLVVQRKLCMPLYVWVCACARVWRKWRTVSHQISTTFSHFKAIGLRASAGITQRLSPPDTVMKSCTYKGFCEKAHGSSSGAKMECCFGDNCNGPHKSHSHGDHHHNNAGAAASSSLLLVTSLLLRLASSQLWTTLPLPVIYPLLLATFVHLFLTSSKCHFWPLTERFWSLSISGGLSQKNIFQNRSLFLFSSKTWIVMVSKVVLSLLGYVNMHSHQTSDDE